MKTIAKALVEAAVFLEFSGEDIIDPDHAVRQLESIAHILHFASPDEVAAIRQALRQMVDVRQTDSARDSARRFSNAFLESMGVTP